MSFKLSSHPSKVDFPSDYDIKGILGKGTFSVVKLGENKATKEKVAIKIMQKSKIKSRDDLIRIKREIEILSRLKHPNIIKIHRIHEDDKKFYIIMEFCEKGELFNRIVESKCLTEEEAAIFYYQIINGLEYIHKNQVAHRDLKPENLLLRENDLLKIIDFGLSNYTISDELLATPCGSPCYASPEMVSGNKYDGCMIDVWSTGIILYAMLCGYLPFEDNDNDILFQKIFKCKIHYPKALGALPVDLMKKIIVQDPKKRITLEQIKQHRFYLKGKHLFSIKYPELIDEMGDNIDNNKYSTNINPIKELVVKNLQPIDNNKTIKNIKENKEKNRICKDKNYSLKANEIYNTYQPSPIDIYKLANNPNNINRYKDMEKAQIINTEISNANTQLNDSKKKEKKLGLEPLFDSPSSLKSDEIPQDSIPVEISDKKKKIKNMDIKIDLNKNFKEEKKIINLNNKNNLGTGKGYKKIIKAQNRTIEKDIKRPNNINYISSSISKINDRIIDNTYDEEKLSNTLDNTTTIATRMNNYNIKNVKPAKYETINHKVDKNIYLNNKTNPLEEIKYNYLDNKIKMNQNNSENIARINNTVSKRIQKNIINDINKLNDRNNKINTENNMNLGNVNKNFIKINSRLKTSTYDQKNEILNVKNQKQNINEIFNILIIQNDNAKTISFDNKEFNANINLYNNNTNLNKRNTKISLMKRKTMQPFKKKDSNNKKINSKYNNYKNVRNNINLNIDNEYQHHNVKSKNLSMIHNNQNGKLINPIRNTNNNNIYINNNSTNYEGMSSLNDKYFDTITINNNNNFNLHEPKLYIYVQNNNPKNITSYKKLKTEINSNKRKIIFKNDNRNNNIPNNVNKINSVEYNQIIPGKIIKAKFLNNTFNNELDFIRQNNKITPIKNRQIINIGKDTKKNEKFIISQKIYNTNEPSNTKRYTYFPDNIVFNNTERNYFNNPINKSQKNNNVIIQASNLSKSIDKINYNYQNMHNHLKTDVNFYVLNYGKENLLNTDNDLLMDNNFYSNNNQRIINGKEEINYKRFNYDNVDYKLQKMKMINNIKNNKDNENKNLKYIIQKAENSNNYRFVY